jgi:hypothetical protein
MDHFAGLDISLNETSVCIVHRIWVDGTEFRWTREQATVAA